jgi:DNA recombination protein RmuC
VTTAAWLGPVVAGTAVLIAAAVLVVVWQLRAALARRDDGGASLALLQQQLDALRGQLGTGLTGQSQLLGQHLAQLTQQVNERLRESLDVVQRSQASVGERLDNTARVVGDVQRGLGELREATAKVFEVGRSVNQLHDILKAPKLRGGFGELLLGDILTQVLPAEHVALQHEFKSGERVDAAIKLGDGLVPIDAKFPLEDFRRMLDAPDDEARARARKAFVARVRKHVDDVAAKYVVPDEGTYDFALMYIPAENVFYEAIVRDETRELTSYALERKVVPVSPNTLYAYLQAIALGLRGMRIEAQAQEVMGRLQRLTGELGRVRDDMRLAGKHLGNAQACFAAAERRLDKFEQRLTLATGAETREPAQPERKVTQLELRVPATVSGSGSGSAS